MYYSHRIGGNRNVDTIDERRSKLDRNRVFYCHLSPDWRQMAIEKALFLTIFDPRSPIVKSVFDCCLSSVLLYIKILKYTIVTYQFSQNISS